MAEGQLKMSRFWTVWREFGGTPTVKHWTKGDAIAEAKRLAAIEPGVRFAVMKAVDCYMTAKPDVERVPVYTPDPNEIPF